MVCHYKREGHLKSLELLYNYRCIKLRIYQYLIWSSAHVSLTLDNNLQTSDKIESFFRKWAMCDASDQNQGTWSVTSFYNIFEYSEWYHLSCSPLPTHISLNYHSRSQLRTPYWWLIWFLNTPLVNLWAYFRLKIESKKNFVGQST